MKRWSVPLLVMFVMICLVSNSLLSAPQPEPSPANVKALLKRVEQLEKRVAELEENRRLTVQSTQGPSKAPVQLPGLQRNVPPAFPIPRDWKENQINGIKYYIVPLASSKDRNDSHGIHPHRN